MMCVLNKQRLRLITNKLFLIILFIPVLLSFPSHAQDNQVRRLIYDMNNGNENAKILLAIRYLHGDGVEKNRPLGLSMLEQVAENGNHDVQYVVGKIYQEGDDGILQNIDKALYWYKKAAEGNNGDALNELGNFYMNAIGVFPDFNIAKQYYIKACEQNNSYAFLNLGNILERTQTRINGNDHIWYYQRAAEKGVPDAQYLLGEYYYDETHLEKNDSLATHWLSLAAAQGHASAQNLLGIIHEKSGDYSIASLWYRRAVENGSGAARVNLGTCYLYGYGVQQDIPAALSLFREAANEGAVGAYMNLALYYYSLQNYELAYQYFKYCAEDFPEANDYLKIISQRSVELEKLSSQKCAILIGNSSYLKMNELPCCINDLSLIENSIREKVDTIITIRNTTRKDMLAAINDAESAIKKNNYSLIFVYYSGHGVESNGKCYIVPTDAPGVSFSSTEEYDSYCYRFNLAINQIRNKNGLVIAVFDACRLNGTNQEKSWHGADSPQKNIYYVYTASSGQSSSATDSPYAKAFSKAVSTSKGKNILLFLNDVNREVYYNTFHNPVLSFSIIDTQLDSLSF